MDLRGWYRNIGSGDLHFDQDGQEWLVRFGEVLPESGQSLAVSGHEYSTDNPWLLVRLRVGRAESQLCLRVFYEEQPVRFVLDGHGEEPSLALLDAVMRAVTLASQQVGNGPTTAHSWSAVLVQSPKSLAPAAERLTAEVSIGGLQLEPLGIIFKDPFPSAPTGSILEGTWGVRQSVPIRVCGQTDGYAWDGDASKKAARTLRTLCGLLSICWEHEYEVAQPAAPLSWGLRKGRERRPWYGEPLDVPDEPQEWHAHRVPAWICDAWTTLHEKPHISYAVDAYLEARYAKERHPSLAAVAYVASIEIIASKLFKTERCPTCKTSLGIAKKFKAALRVVLSESDAGELDPLYNHRSRTVHDGRLHGGESTPGARPLFFGIFSGDSTENFREKKLRLLDDAARKLIILGLRGMLPPQERLSQETAD